MATENQKQFLVSIELEAFEVHISAKNSTEARKKALDRLSKKNPTNLIRISWPKNRKEINIDEF